MEAGKGSTDLEKEVLNEGLCTSCGACVNICPYIKVIKDRVAVIEPCGITDGKCYDFCPRTMTDIAELDRKVFGQERSDSSLGSYISIEMAQAKDIETRSRAQYGGEVSALTAYAISKGEVGATVLTKPLNGSIMPRAVVVEESSQVLGCAGSNYIASATMAVLNEAMKPRLEQMRQPTRENAATLAGLNKAVRHQTGSLGIVGMPCQILALRKMQASNHENGANAVKLAIGLFCTWALSYKGFYNFLRGKLDPAQIKRLDIPPPPANKLVVDTGSDKIEFPLDDIRGCIKPACGICFDMTSEFADLSVGMVEDDKDWNTLIVRTPAAKRLVDKAKEDGIIETKPLPEENLSHLREASLLKKKRALDEIVKRTGDENNLLYLRLPDTVLRNIR